MTIYSTEPVVQTYWSTFLKDLSGKESVIYGRLGGFCMEMTRFADVVVHEVEADETAEKSAYIAAKRDSTLLKPGEVYKQQTIYAFAY